MSGTRPAGVIGLLAAAVAAGAATGVALERRAVGRVRSRPDPEAREPFGSLHTAPRTVFADDGVPLHVEVDGDDEAELTVVFVHGFVLSMDCWHYQRRDLGGHDHGAGKAAARLVFYDQRSHGSSGRSAKANATIDQLGRDLYAVLEAVAPRGPVVLVGHSMGGMTIMALADQRPELFGDRIVGVALISTSPGLRGEAILGMPALAGRALEPVAPRLVDVINRRAALVERGRNAGSDLAFLMTRRYGFGGKPPPSQVAFLERMVTHTPIEVMSEFFPTFIDHDKLDCLPVLSDVETLVLVGDRDLLTPTEHSRRIARETPHSELVVLAGAGHMVILERAGLVNLHLRALLGRVQRRLAGRATRP